jgi:hypothetical protein
LGVITQSLVNPLPCTSEVSTPQLVLASQKYKFSVGFPILPTTLYVEGKEAKQEYQGK